MKKEELDEIKKSAAEKYDGDIELAIAASIYGDGVIARCGNQVPSFADPKQLAAVKGQITRLENAAKKENSKKAKND